MGAPGRDGPGRSLAGRRTLSCSSPRERTMRRPRLRHHFRQLDLSRRVAMRALAAFLVTFGFLRALTAVIHFHLLPIHDVVTRTGLHLHHLFWGILLLMVTGFAALATRDPAWHLRIAVVFGCAMALTLDEFALWLRLADVYWTREGLASIKAAAVATAVLALLALGGPFWRNIWRDVRGRRR